MSNTDDKHNGWTNRETWAVALHINNDQGWQESVLDALRTPWTPSKESQTPAVWAGEIIRENVEETLELLWGGHDTCLEGDYHATAFGLVREDIGSLWRVDWTELGAAFLSDLAEDDA